MARTRLSSGLLQPRSIVHQHLAYRAHIDGLRAVAVLGVVLFHFGAKWLPGGFVGVDVFFVISGYLISKSIYADTAEGSFSILGFYERRIRRIAPAFLFVTALTALAAWLLLLPQEMFTFARSLLWSTFGFGNVFFFLETDYFGPAAQEMPLLHYWSLGVEEQFYLLFPALVLLFRRGGPRWLVGMVLGLLLVSLAASQLALGTHRAAAYYLLPFRAFELLIGSALALPGGRAPRSDVERMAAVAGGCAMVLGAMLMLKSTAPFPGLRALIPCIGSALVIWGGEGGAPLVVRLLSARVPVYIGRISYSLYLVHWPIATLGRAALDTAGIAPVAAPVFLIGGTLASLALAALSYRFVEQPFRRNKALFTPRRMVGGLVACTAALALFAQWGIATRGLPSRFGPAIEALSPYVDYDGAQVFSWHRCFTPSMQPTPDIAPECLPTTHPSVMVWGNSHIAHFIGAIREAAQQRGYAVGEITGGACPPLLFGATRAVPYCKAMNEFAFDWVLKNRPDILVLGGVLAVTPDIAAKIAEIAALGVRVVVVGPVPLYGTPVPTLLSRRLIAGNADTMAGDDMLPLTRNYEAQLAGQLAGNPDVTFVSVLKTACPAGDCPIAIDGQPLQYDNTHFTRAGVAFFGRPVAAAIFGEAAPAR
ncbi:acyltransferase [Starkeya koreensis]|uniref:Acyltransferase n=1 Tax=Ancylobacter koreensis TaxID=266121 RepID=A0ABT0DRA7_9HYPH|nr:acyltransferase family protein [Ancylobacter koreensis]MCK0209818.1 acyltransferase [Ancylobacter koreensis]